MTKRRAIGLLIAALFAAAITPATSLAPNVFANEFLHRVFMPITAERVSTSVGGTSDNDGSYISHYDPVFIVDIGGRVHVGGALPPDRTIIYAGGTGNMNRYVANWAVGDRTGFYPERSFRSSQRGIPNGTYGTSAVQMEAFTAGMHLAVNAGDADAAAQFAQLYYDFQVRPHPWSFASNPRLCMDYDISVVRSIAPTGGINYAYALVELQESVTAKSIWLLITFFDSRPDVIDRGDSISWWQEADAPIIYGYFGSDGYTTLMPESESSTSVTWDDWRYYGFCMSSVQLLDAIRMINQTYGSDLPESTATYYLSAFGVGPEIYNPGLDDAEISVRVRDVRLFTLADPGE